MTNHEAFEIHESHEHPAGSKTCRVCSSSYCHDDNPSFFCICERCGFKILIVLVVLMVAVSYIAWYGVI
jgi:hypothetical protein